MTRRSVGASLLVVALSTAACGGERAAGTTSLPPSPETSSTTLPASTTTAAERHDGGTSTTLAIDDIVAETQRGEGSDGAAGDEAGEQLAPSIGDYVEISDNGIAVSVPADWSDTVSQPWDLNGELVGPSLGAAPDYGAFLDGWDTPGVFIAASRRLEATTADMLDSNDFSSVCQYVDRIDYDDGFYVGLMDVWEQCGGESSFVVIVAEPPDGDYLALIQLVIVHEADWDAADQVIRTFRVIDPNVP